MRASLELVRKEEQFYSRDHAPHRKAARLPNGDVTFLRIHPDTAAGNMVEGFAPRPVVRAQAAHVRQSFNLFDPSNAFAAPQPPRPKPGGRPRHKGAAPARLPPAPPGNSGKPRHHRGNNYNHNYNQSQSHNHNQDRNHNHHDDQRNASHLPSSSQHVRSAAACGSPREAQSCASRSRHAAADGGHGSRDASASRSKGCAANNSQNSSNNDNNNNTHNSTLDTIHTHNNTHNNNNNGSNININSNTNNNINGNNNGSNINSNTNNNINGNNINGNSNSNSNSTNNNDNSKRRPSTFNAHRAQLNLFEGDGANPGDLPAWAEGPGAFGGSLRPLSKIWAANEGPRAVAEAKVCRRRPVRALGRWLRLADRRQLDGKYHTRRTAARDKPPGGTPASTPLLDAACLRRLHLFGELPETLPPAMLHSLKLTPGTQPFPPTDPAIVSAASQLARLPRGLSAKRLRMLRKVACRKADIVTDLNRNARGGLDPEPGGARAADGNGRAVQHEQEAIFTSISERDPALRVRRDRHADGWSEQRPAEACQFAPRPPTGKRPGNRPSTAAY